MFGSIPCYPGYKKTPEYKNCYFFCELCDSIVSPTNVDVSVVSTNQPTAKPESKLSVLRCKNHPTKGLQSGGSITSLKGLLPSSISSTETHQKMLKLCSHVRYLDVLTLCCTILAALCAIAGVILQFVITAPLASFIPFVLLGVAIALSLGAFSCSQIAKKITQRWQELSKQVIRSSINVPVQAGTERYTLLTEFPPTCYRIPTPVPSTYVSHTPIRCPKVSLIVKKTACKLSARTKKIIANRR